MPDLSSCDREPITRLGTIQGFGFLVALTNDWIVSKVSANVEQHLGWKVDEVLGTPFGDLIGRQAQHELRNRMGFLYSIGSERIYGIKLLGTTRRFDLALHFQGDLLVIEGEPSQAADGMEAASMVRAMAARLARDEDLATFHRTAARQIQALTGFDRVMVYEFDREGHGEVIAEASRSGLAPFLGLHFPASDIPAQARALYLRNPFRIIHDVDAPSVPILPQAGALSGELDLSMAITRAVSPVHLEYLRNMGVRASMSISIIVDGRLWGLIACHAFEPKLPSFVMRTAAELLGGMVGMMLGGRLNAEAAEAEAHARALTDKLITAIAGDPNLLSDPEWLQGVVSDMIECDGVAVFRAGHVFTHGLTPPPKQVERISRHLNIASPSRVLATDRLAALMPGLEDCAKVAPGMLSIPISRVPRDYVMLFRQEMLATITWGGDPNKPVEFSDGTERVSPRKSFAAFNEEVRGRSTPFSGRDERIAESVRLALIEVILRHIDIAADDRRRASERQELLIAELNHRVRNILALIRSLITTTGGTADSLGDYVESLSGRVQALARAHDQITRQNWGPALLSSLFDDEIAALPGARDRLVVNGPPVMLQPTALSTLSLVIHELVTNSCKHGALSTTGRVEVAVETDEAHGLTVRWRELGGPAVRAPERRGFGSMVIERTIPFDLQGTAEVRFALSGLEADFQVPTHYIVVPTAAEPPNADDGAGEGTAPLRSDSETDDLPLAGCSVLLVEDNMLIALEAEDMLRALGAAEVEAASTLAAAEALLARGSFDFAMLDINLGQSTTFDLATRLGEARVPYVFASGYGEEVALQAKSPTAVVLQKPYQKEHLRNGVKQVRAAVTAT
ncbi:HWE histidine kinase domain-containing protein [Sphingomonas sp. LHG3406-1]|uniref:HWE histidine kinase domain-containing protein n=1 Tax=Sphingomonas sp. LHG3406-1 TaxID=2804617 RepID=UPI00260AF064|nr:HWE histidine kinase domain-containing protein [Sphingomonas sp. LHG3406-1]